MARPRSTDPAAIARRQAKADRETAVVKRREQVAALLARRFTQAEIAAKLQSPPMMISRDVKWLEKQWEERTEGHFDQYRMREARDLEAMERDAQLNYENALRLRAQCEDQKGKIFLDDAWKAFDQSARAWQAQRQSLKAQRAKLLNLNLQTPPPDESKRPPSITFIVEGAAPRVLPPGNGRVIEGSAVSHDDA